MSRAALRMAPTTGLHRRAWFAACVTGALGLGGCATAPMPRSAGDRHWSGRLSLTVHNEPPQRHTASFDLSGTPQAGELLLHSPLGQTLASLRWTPQLAQWQQGQQITQRDSLQNLVAELGEGAALPVEALFDWLDGRSGEASGWTVDLSAHAQGRVSATRVSPSPRADLRIVLSP